MSFKETALAKLRELAKKHKHPNPLCEGIEEQVISEAIALVKYLQIEADGLKNVLFRFV